MKKLIVIFIVLSAILLAYHLLSSTIANKIVESYGEDLNEERMKIGLQKIDNNTHCDSITYFGEGNAKDLSFKFNNEKYFTKGWTFSCSNDSTCYKDKMLGYLMSYWFWENKIQYEIDTYIHPLSKLENEELIVAYDFEKEEYFARLDTVKSELAESLKTKHIDSIYQYAEDNNLVICGTAMMELEMGDDFMISEIDTIGLSKKNVDLILKNWNIKLK